MQADICHGKPCVGGMRYPVTMVLDLLGAGMTSEEILSDFSDLQPEDILACLQFAARAIDVKSLARDAA